jgi:YD repeat-containing protein
MSSIAQSPVLGAAAAPQAATATDPQTATASAVMGEGDLPTGNGSADAPIPMLRDAVASAANAYANGAASGSSVLDPNYNFLYNANHSSANDGGVIKNQIGSVPSGAVLGGSVTADVARAQIKDPDAARMAMALMGYGQSAGGALAETATPGVPAAPPRVEAPSVIVHAAAAAPAIMAPLIAPHSPTPATTVPSTSLAPSPQSPAAPNLPAGVRFDDTAALGADTAAAALPSSSADVDGYLPKAVALMSGNDLGLVGSSLDRLGGQGMVGALSNTTARTTSGESLYINTATGNLVVQRTDELLVGLGPDAQVLRTYNSQTSGQAQLDGRGDGDNNDNWRIGFYRQVCSLTGTVNTTGSTVVRVEADGAQRTYTFNGTLYVNEDGTGAHDTLSFNAGTANSAATWTWTDGNSRVVETYAALASGSSANSAGRLLSTQDIDGNTIAYAYDSAGLLIKVTTAVTTANTTGQQLNQTELVYDSTAGRTANLLELKTTAWNAQTQSNQVLTRTRYSYDAGNRLERVTTDLSPEDNSLAATGSSNPNDGKTYSTTYTYDGSSKRIASITESNRARVSFVYDGQGRVSQFTEGGGRTTSLSYNTAATSTSSTAGTNTSTGTGTSITYTVKATDLAAANPWAAITQTLFGAAAASDATAVANLRAAVGNPGLSVGTVITPPASLSYSSTQTVPANLVAQNTVSPTSEWKPIAGLESSGVAAYAPQVAFAPNGDGLSVWMQGSDLMAATYSKTTGAWSTPIAIDGSNVGNPILPHLSSSANGNMLVTWKQGSTIYASRYVGGAWDSTPSALSNSVVGGAYYSTGAISDSGKATVVFAGSDGYRWNAVANTFNGSSWQSSPVQVDDVGGANDNGVTSNKYPRVAMDAAGNAVMTWVQAANGETAASLFISRYVVSTGAWTAPSSTLLENTNVDVKAFQLALDNQGNGLATWSQGSSVYAKSYTANAQSGQNGQQWGALQTLSNTATGEISLAMSANANAVVAYTTAAISNAAASSNNNNAIYANRFVNGALVGSTAELISNGTATSAWAPSASINDQGQAAVSFLEDSGSGDRVTTNRYQSGLWQGGALTQSLGTSPQKPIAAIDAAGNVQVLMSVQVDGINSLYARRFENAGAPYYQIPTGATWSSVAQTLYGSGSGSAVSALKQALSLSSTAALPAVGTRLQGLPSSLSEQPSGCGHCSCARSPSACDPRQHLGQLARRCHVGGHHRPAGPTNPSGQRRQRPPHRGAWAAGGGCGWRGWNSQPGHSIPIH